MTPLKGLTFVYGEIFLNERNSPEVWCEFMSWKDNPFLDKRETKLLESSLSEEQLESRRDGRFRSGTGLVYPEFDETVNVTDPFEVPREWYDTVSIDPGLNNPARRAVVRGGLRRQRVRCGGALRGGTGRGVSRGEDTRNQFAARLGNGRARSGARAHRSRGEPENARRGQKRERAFYEHGIAVNASVNKDIFSGIQRVKGYLRAADGKSRLYIFRNCVNLVRELKSYWWGEGDRPVKKDDHCLDALRYYLMNRPERKPPRTESEAARIKSSIVKKLKGEREKGAYN